MKRKQEHFIGKGLKQALWSVSKILLKDDVLNMVLKKSFNKKKKYKVTSKIVKKNKKTIQQHVKYYKKVLQQNIVYNDNIDNII